MIKSSTNDELFYNIANSYYMKGSIEQAIKFYYKSLEINPKKIECYYNLGNANCALENYKEA